MGSTESQRVRENLLIDHTHARMWTVTTQERALRLDTRHRVCGVPFGISGGQLHPQKQCHCCWWRRGFICSCAVSYQWCIKRTVISWCLLMGKKGDSWERKMVMPLAQTRDSVQRSVVSDSLWLHAMQHARLPCPLPTPGVTQTHVHWVGDAIQPSHPLLSPSPPALIPSQHQGLLQWVSSSHQVAKVLEFQFQHQSFQWTPRTDLL